jgi:hypothetical protein
MKREDEFATDTPFHWNSKRRLGLLESVQRFSADMLARLIHEIAPEGNTDYCFIQTVYWRPPILPRNFLEKND